MQEIFTTLQSFYMFDIWVFSQWWMYVFVLPIFIYVPFFFLKWILLTAPIWMPITIVVNSIFQKDKPSNQRRNF